MRKLLNALSVSFLSYLNKEKMHVPLFNLAPLHGDELGIGGIPPHILDLGTRWRGTVRFIPRLLYHQEGAPDIHWMEWNS
jgi:hypothetical protein